MDDFILPSALGGRSAGQDRVMGPNPLARRLAIKRLVQRFFAHSGRCDGVSRSSLKDCEGIGGKDTSPEDAVLRPAASRTVTPTGSRPGSVLRGSGCSLGFGLDALCSASRA